MTVVFTVNPWLPQLPMFYCQFNTVFLTVCAAHQLHSVWLKQQAKTAQSTFFKKKKKISFAFFLVASQKSLMTWLTLWTRLTAGFVMRHRGWSGWRPSQPPVVSLSPDALTSSPVMSNKSCLLISWKNQLMFFHCCVFPKKFRLFCQVLLVLFF